MKRNHLRIVRITRSQGAGFWSCLLARFMLVVICMQGLGCTVAPPMAPSPPLVGGAPAAAASPMTLPRYLGIESMTSGFRRVVYRSRLRMSNYIPALEPLPPNAAPAALCGPGCLESPAPAVATAAAIQQAEASAPAKVKALAYLAGMDCSRNPQVEEAILAGMDDPSDRVRIGAIQAVLDGTNQCGACSCCGGCCTPAIHQKLNAIAFGTDDRGCHLEPNSKVRRLARIAIGKCGAPMSELVPDVPEEVPPPAVLEMLQLPAPQAK